MGTRKSRYGARGLSLLPAVLGPKAKSNALTESMLSGSKTIRVHATLSYSYETPLDGVIFKTLKSSRSNRP